MERRTEPQSSNWAALREAQSMALSLPNTGQAVAIDIGDAEDIHPKNKQEVGRRLALNALHLTYGMEVVYSGPVYEGMETMGDTIILKFAHTGSGLRAKNSDQVHGFSIAGEDKHFVWAEAKIMGDDLYVWSVDVDHPEAVRYGWADNPDCNLFNIEGFPASPFRTDSWELKIK